MKIKEIKIGKLNVVDLTIILFVVIFFVIFGVGKIKNSGDNITPTSSSNITFSYTLKVEGISETSRDMLKVGDEVYEREANTYIGKIKNLEITEAKSQLQKNNGEIIETKMPTKIDVTMEIETTGIIKNDEYLANNLIRIMVGATEKVKTKYLMCTAKVIDLER